MAKSLFTTQPRSFDLDQNQKSLTSWLLIIYIPVILLLIALSLQPIMPVSYLTRDPQAIAGVPFYTGLLSNVGVLLWCTTSAICFFTFSVFKKIQANFKMRSFVLYSGLLTLMLLIDDLWMVHEEVAPNYLQIPEKLVYLFYFGAFCLYFSKFFKVIFKTEFLPLILAFVWFGLSILVDKSEGLNLAAGFNHEILYTIEDSFKLLGIVSWCVYFVGVCQKSLQEFWHLNNERRVREEISYSPLVLTK
jgi:hypothetical protein